MEDQAKRKEPYLLSVSPISGPIYGGFVVSIEGRGLYETHELSVIFTYQPAKTKIHFKEHPEEKLSEEKSYIVQTVGTYISPERVTCKLPSFPREGLYSVTLQLNGCILNEEEGHTLCITIWRNWQKKKLLELPRHETPRIIRDKEGNVLEGPATANRPPYIGPTHYDPKYRLVKASPRITTIFPTRPEVTETSGYPSEVHMNYNAFKATKPKAPQAFFSQRKYSPSWCNPIVPEYYRNHGIEGLSPMRFRKRGPVADIAPILSLQKPDEAQTEAKSEVKAEAVAVASADGNNQVDYPGESYSLNGTKYEAEVLPSNLTGNTSCDTESEVPEEASKFPPSTSVTKGVNAPASSKKESDYIPLTDTAVTELNEIMASRSSGNGSALLRANMSPLYVKILNLKSIQL